MKPPHNAHRFRALIGLTLIIATSFQILSLAVAASSSSSATKSSSGLRQSSSVADKQLKKLNDESQHLNHQLQQTQAQSQVQQQQQQQQQNHHHHHQSISRSEPLLPIASAVPQKDTAIGQQQPIAEKKQGDVVSSASSAQDPLLNDQEYVQIKPEEINVSEQQDKAMIEAAINSAVSLDNQPQQQNQQGQQQSSSAEQKSSLVDEELNAHLSHDSIAQQESAYRPAYTAPPIGPAARPQPYGIPSQRAPVPAHATAYNNKAPEISNSGSQQLDAYQSRPPVMARGPRSSPRLPPSYITLKGKLTGINSIISQYPHPAPGYPHQVPRHLPRGAAAGYAAFRDFVRAHASKYKQMAAPNVLVVAQPPASYSVAPPLSAPSSYQQQAPETEKQPQQYQQQQPKGSQYQQAAPQYGAGPAEYSSATPAAPSYGPPAPSYGPPAPSYSPSAPSYSPPKTPAPQTKTKVTVAQAYIPHMTPIGATGYQQQHSAQALTAYANPILSKLYGGHAPQGLGKPEYSRDYGMVIHYPQATVYTEPMTVEQLHKLTGAGISQVLEQLQYNLANGHRDESNTIHTNNKHHLGDGVTIHAKEYYAPGKGGNYVPTTAAVISAPNKYSSATSDSYGTPEQPASTGGGGGAASASGYTQGSSYEQAPISNAALYDASPRDVTLGSGYDRVKQAVLASQQQQPENGKYNANNNKYMTSGAYAPAPAAANAPPAYEAAAAPPPAPPAAPASSYQPASGGSGSSKYAPAANGEPLSTIGNLIGSELESLYKANAALTKHLEPEIQQALSKAASYAKKAASGALKYHDLGARSPFSSHSFPFMSAPYHQPQPTRGYAGPPKYHPNRPTGGRYNREPQGPPRYGRHGQRKGPGGARYHGQRPMPYGGQRPPSGGHPQNYGRPQHASSSAQYQGPKPSYQAQAPQYGASAVRQQPQLNYQQQSATEQALNQQMMQMLHEFQNSDEQYNGKNQPLHSINQGYPNKVMQKYQKQPQPYNQQQQQRPQQQSQKANYGPKQQQQQQHEPLELPAGPNDQIGEVADLIEALKGALDLSKPEPVGSINSGSNSYSAVENGYQASGNGAEKQYQATGAKPLDEVRYLASALGQAPSYALQVPVSNGNNYGSNNYAPSSSPSYDSAPKKSAPDSYQSSQEQAGPAYQQQAQGGQYQQPQADYGQELGGSYGSTANGGSYAQAAAQQAYGGAPQAAYDAAPVSGGYHQSKQTSSTGYPAQAPAQANYGGAQNSGEANYGGAAPQQVASQSDYSSGSAAAANQYQQQPVAPPSGSYGQSSQVTSTYGQAAPEYQQPSTSSSTGKAYSTSEHTQVINHLVPGAAAPQSAPTNAASPQYHQSQAAQSVGYNSGNSNQQQQQQQHYGQEQAALAIAAPTDSQYQQAQSLSSFVDSLSNDYHELLRQPSHLLDGANVPSQLALLNSNQQQQQQYDSGYSSNATSSVMAAASSPVSSQVAPPASVASSAAVAPSNVSSNSQDSHQAVRQSSQQANNAAVSHQQQDSYLSQTKGGQASSTSSSSSSNGNSSQQHQ